MHSGDRAQFLEALVRVGLPASFLLTLAWFLALGKGWIGIGTFLLLLTAGNLVASFALAILIIWVSTLAGDSFARMVLAGGNLPPAPSFSSEESLVARGFYREAFEQYQAYLAAHPGDIEVRLRLADLARRHLSDPALAERLYLEIRQLSPAPNQERLATNLLIELYRELGRRDRVKVELARFAERYRGSKAADDARRALRELKDQDG